MDKNNINRLGDTVEPWFQELEGVRVNTAALSKWHDFSDPAQIIFGYPETPGTYAVIYPTQVDSSDSDGIKLFFFIQVVDGFFRGLSYSIVDVDPMGAGIHMDLHAFEPDITVMENYLFSISTPEDHARIQVAIDNRLRKLPLDELLMARDFFQQINNVPIQFEKYNNIIKERE